MSLLNYLKQIWDTTSYVNPTRMNHIEDGIYAVSNKVDNLSADDIPYDSNNSVKDMIDNANGDIFTYTADGSKTYAQCFNALFNLCKSKINVNKWQDIKFYIKISDSTLVPFVCNTATGVQLKFSRANSDNINWSIATITLNESSSSYLEYSNSGGTVYTNQVPASGNIFCVNIKTLN